MVGIRQWRTGAPADLTDDDGAFSFSWPTAAEERALWLSLSRHGVLRPLLCVLVAGAVPRLVAGRRRRAWAVAEGLATVPCAELEACAPAPLWDRLLAEAQDHRPLNPVEVGLYLRRRMAHSGESLETLAPEVLPALGLPPRAAAAADVLWVSALPAEYRHGFADGSRPLHAARLLAAASRQDALAVLALSDGLVGGVNKFTELVRTLLECAWRDGLPVAEWLEREGLCRRWEGLDPLREQLRHRRYPHLSRWEEAFPQVVAAAGLPSRVGIHPPRGFEGAHYQCRLTFTSLDELSQDLGAVREGLDAGRLDPFKEFLG